MYIETGQVQGREVEQELRLNTPRRQPHEQAACLQTHSVPVCGCVLSFGRQDVQWLRACSLVSGRQGLSLGSLVMNQKFSELLWALLLSSVQQRTISVSIEQIKWDNLSGNLTWRWWWLLTWMHHCYARLEWLNYRGVVWEFLKFQARIFLQGRLSGEPVSVSASVCRSAPKM